MLKKHVVFNLRKRTINLPKKKKKADYKIMIYFSLMVSGAVLGANIFKSSSPETDNLLSSIFISLFTPDNTQGLLMNFFKILLPFIVLISLSYVIGLCGAGIPILALVPLVSGIFAGAYVGLCYGAYGLREAVCRMLVFLPSYAIAAASLIKCCCRSTVISGEIFSFLLTGKGEGKALLKDYTVEYAVLTVPVIIGSAVSLCTFSILEELFHVFS